MKKLLFLFILAALSVASFGQVRIYTDQLLLDSVTFDRIKWIRGVSNDTTLNGADSNKVVTEFAVAKAIDNIGVPAGTLDSIATHTDTLQAHNIRINANYNSIVSKQDSIAVHTDSIQSHNLRIKANALLITAKQDSIDSHTDTLQNHNLRINALIAWALDSIAQHTDTLQSHNVRLKALEAGGASGLSTAKFIYICTTDTTSTTPNNTGYFLGMDEDYDGFQLVRVVAMSAGAAGDRTPTVNIYRNRGGVEVAMTSTGANLTTDAVINPTYDDIQDADKLEVRWTYAAGTTAPDGLYVILTIQEP